MSASLCFVKKYLSDSATEGTANYNSALFRTYIYYDQLAKDLSAPYVSIKCHGHPKLMCVWHCRNAIDSSLIVTATDKNGFTFVYDATGIPSGSATPPPAVTQADVDRAWIIMGVIAGVLFIVAVGLLIGLVQAKRKAYRPL